MQDLIPVAAFILTYAVARLLGHAETAMYVATAALMIAVCAQIIWLKAHQRPVEKRLWISAGIIVVLGAITLILRDPHIIQLKPTLLNIVIAAVFLGSQWIGKANLCKRMLHSAFTMPERLWTRLNVAWAVFFLLEGALNLWIAKHYSYDFWVGFKLWGLMGLTFLFLIGQFFLLRRYLNLDKE